MCGVTGFIRSTGFEIIEAESKLRRMSASLVHRGPDDEGLWLDETAGVALAHRRLAIVDLTPAGHQPMHSASERYVLVFNGEIYNHRALRRELEGSGVAPAWRGHSDTETLLACFDAWGIRRTLESCVGMFAIALWDRRERKLSLARDRMGEKPLYYGWRQGYFLFGSELKSLTAHDSSTWELDRAAVGAFLRLGYVPAPHSIWRGIKKLPPGTWFTLSSSNGEESLEQYWSLKDVAETASREPLLEGDEGARVAVEKVLLEAVGSQMVADVPLGALLSGGVDSSAIVALMQAQSSRPVRTFSIGFREAEFDESAHAAAVARHLGTEHTELFMVARDVLDAVPRMPSMYDEPFADSSQLPTSLVMALARQQVTVALSGDGGDELFGGYNRYLMGPKLWRSLRNVPVGARQALARLLVTVSPAFWDGLARPFSKLTGQSHVGNKLQKLGQRISNVRNVDDLYLALVAEGSHLDSILSEPQAAPSLLDQRERWPQLEEPVSRMMALDASTYLPDDILVKVDRAAMAVSLETRAPFLDHRVVELAWRLPLEQKLRAGQGKFALRSVLYRYVPPELIERPKVGFGVPLDRWLRSELREWAETLLSESALSSRGIFRADAVRGLWKQHLSGRRSYGSSLWSILMLQAWLNEQRAVI